jgi:uncharacterized protein YbjQ (UPF0145 family)
VRSVSIIPRNATIQGLLYGAESIALINVNDPEHHGQDAMDSALKNLKNEAASMGSNGVVVTSQFSTKNVGAVISGTAIFVP